MSKVLCFGSLNIDYVYKVRHFVKKGETISSEGLEVFSGGKGLNQSVALGKAGCEVFHAGMIGRDGLFLLDVLKDAGVDTSLVHVSDTVRTGNAIIQNDAAGDNCIILYPGANRCITPEMIDTVLEGFNKGDCIILQNEINGLDLITRRAVEKGIVVILNPSPMNDYLTEEIIGRAEWLVLNEVEAMQITGCESDDAGALSEALRQAYPGKKFVLTLGEKGSCYIDGERVIMQDIFPAEVVDTTAAGDTFMGYFVAGLIEGRDIERCLEMAAKASAIAVSRPGAAPSIPVRSEIK